MELALEAARQLNTRSVAARLVSAVTSFSVTTPLWFESPVTRAIKSDAVKEQEALAAIAAKEGSFQFPTQYVEGVTALIPGLMNYMFSRRIQNKKLTYETAKHVVRNIY